MRLEEAVRMRLRGEHFFSRFTFTHPGLIRILKTAAESLALEDAEARRSAFERLARLEGINDAHGRPIRRADKDLARAATLSMIARLSEASLVCTQEERRLFELLFESALAGFETQMTAPAPSGFVPASLPTAREREAFVVWAPLEPAWRTSLAVRALDQLGLPTVVVCRDGALPNVRARFVRPHEAAPVLARACAVLDLAVNDPGDALALAKLGVPLAVSYLSGAYEVLDGVAIYRAWMQRDIEMAALTALGLSAARSLDVPAVAPAYREPPNDGKPVAIDGDPHAATDQRYANITGASGAAYVAHVPPGATLFDTHIGLLVEAVERSGADRAISDAIYRIPDAPGYAVAEGALTLARTRTQGTSVVRVPRVTGLLHA